MQNTQIAHMIKHMCNVKNIPIALLLSECNLTKSFIYDLEKRNTSPSCDKIFKIANYLNCSVDYLLTGQEKSPGLKPELAEIIRCYEQADPETKGYVKGLLGVRPTIQLDKDEEQFVADARKVYRQEKDEGSVTSSVKELDAG